MAGEIVVKKCAGNICDVLHVIIERFQMISQLFYIMIAK